MYKINVFILKLDFFDKINKDLFHTKVCIKKLHQQKEFPLKQNY